MIEVKFRKCRQADAAFFERSGALDESTFAHQPWIALVVDETGETPKVSAVVIRDMAQLIELPADTPVMRQWAGAKRSDCFKTTAGEVEEALMRQVQG